MIARRRAARELMDDPAVEEEDLRGALVQLDEINRVLGGRRPSLGGLERLTPVDRRELSLLDVGCGGGDVTRCIARWGRRRGVDIDITAIDVSDVCVRFARERSAGLPIRYETADLFDLPGDGAFDVVHASLALHHFDGEDAARALAKMFSLARLGVVINDLHRHAFAYHAIRALTAVRWRNRLVRHDGPISVLRGFSRRDLQEIAADAGVPAPEITWQWAFRWRVVVPRSPVPSNVCGPVERDRGAVR